MLRIFLVSVTIGYLNNMAWIRIRMDPKLLPGSESGTRKIQSWIRIRNKSLWIHNTAYSIIKLVLLSVSYYQTRLLTIHNFGRFWQLITFICCIFINTGQKSICASTVFKAKTEKNEEIYSLLYLECCANLDVHLHCILCEFYMFPCMLCEICTVYFNTCCAKSILMITCMC